ncbi:MAG: smalltalk protein [Bacteroidaceae bacterium]|nr:smalltalk protein [Bacteroidaceae bacterium]
MTIVDSKKSNWTIWVQVVLTVLTAVASALGITSCMGVRLI